MSTYGPATAQGVAVQHRRSGADLGWGPQLDAIIGRSEFADPPDLYNVEIVRDGCVVRQWKPAAELTPVD
ncbi:hypothetical protein GCM10028812_52600 [Ancylobacter sonchi]